MTERLYTSSEVREILDVSQRKMTHFAEKGLIIPVEDAKGAGSKRLYNYVNLLEFALCQMLFDMELGIHLVKRIISDLRESGDIGVWSRHDKQSYISVTSKTYDETIKKDKKEISCEYFPVDIEATDFTSALYYIFTDFQAMSWKKIITIITPLGLNESIKEFNKEHFDISGEILNSKGMIVVNMGVIRQRVDKGAKKIK